MKISKTRHGLRLSQHGVVISEVRITAGPTHSVFDILAALIAELGPGGSGPSSNASKAKNGRVGVLGFAGGGMMAPLRALECHTLIYSCDLDRAAFRLFGQHCAAWLPQVRWQHGDAVRWLRRQSPDFALLLDDLSVPHEGDVLKPDVSWNVLPALMRNRLRPGGLGIFNLLPPATGKWGPRIERLAEHFSAARVIHLDEFENRILIVGRTLPSARGLSERLRCALRRMRSRQANRIHVRMLGRESVKVPLRPDVRTAFVAQHQPCK